MPKEKVFATSPLFPAAQQVLNASCDVEYWTQAERISKEELLRRVERQGWIGVPADRESE